MYPPVCPLCGRISPEGICPSCREKTVPAADGAFCMHCGKPLADEAAEYCPDCRKQMEGGGSCLDQGRSLWLHREPVAGALYRFKYHNRRRWGRLFAKELADRYACQVRRWQTDVVIPVPLHPSRRRKRGFNQAEILARELGARCGVPVRTDVLFRIRRTTPQKALGRTDRMQNLKGAFGVSAAWKPCRNVLLVDDIYTTGATLEHAAKVLRKAGVQNVRFLTISIGQGI